MTAHTGATRKPILSQGVKAEKPFAQIHSVARCSRCYQVIDPDPDHPVCACNLSEAEAREDFADMMTDSRQWYIDQRIRRREERKVRGET